MPTALTPTQIIADIYALNRIERDWSIEGRLDCITEADLKAKKAELLDDLRERFHTQPSEEFGDWYAWEGDMDFDHNGHVYVPTMPIAYGKTEIEAIETLLEMIGEDA
jgi:hypothetical protein